MMTTVTCRCPLCGTASYVTCDADAYFKYATTNALIQDVFPMMDIHTRETLISGMCLQCQESFFVEDEEDDCNGICELCSLGDDCPCSNNY